MEDAGIRCIQERQHGNNEHREPVWEAEKALLDPSRGYAPWWSGSWHSAHWPLFTGCRPNDTRNGAGGRKSGWRRGERGTGRGRSDSPEGLRGPAAEVVGHHNFRASSAWDGQRDPQGCSQHLQGGLQAGHHLLRDDRRSRGGGSRLGYKEDLTRGARRARGSGSTPWE